MTRMPSSGQGASGSKDFSARLIRGGAPLDRSAYLTARRRRRKPGGNLFQWRSTHSRDNGSGCHREGSGASRRYPDGRAQEEGRKVTHSYLSIAFAVAAMAMGLWAAWRWLKASTVRVPQTVATNDGSHLIIQRMVESHAALIEAAHLNKSAALLTALAALLSTLSAIAEVAG